MNRLRTLLLVALMGGALSSPVGSHVRITTDLSFSKDVRAVLRKHCMGCHNKNGAAPDYIDLTTYGNDRAPGARAWATAIEEEIMTGRMPPWQADSRFDHFANTRRMTQEEIDIIVGWVQGGAPQGPRRNLPAPAGYGGEGWILGEPEVVVEAPEAFVLGEGIETGSYSFEVAPGIDDGWITGFEFQPENPGTVYRMAAWIHDPEGAGPESLEVEIQVPYDPFRDEDEPEPTRMRELRSGSHYLGQWLRGDTPVLFPADMGRRIRKGSTVEVRVDYRRRDLDGSTAQLADRSRLGLFLSREVDEVELMLESDSLGDTAVQLKGKKARRPVEASFTFPEDSRVVGFDPNLGELIDSVSLDAVYADGREETLLLIEGYDSEWPASFQLVEPLKAPKGTTIRMTGLFDIGERKSVEQPFEMTLVYAINDHLVLPEVLTPRVERQSRGGMLIGQALAGEGVAIAASGGGAPLDARAAAHMDHSPLHGGQFFMAANQYHHVEGALPVAGRFEFYVYDDFKKPVDPRNFAGRVVFEKWDEENEEWLETAYPMHHGEPGTEFMLAQIPPDLPAEFFASVWLAGEEQRYDFYFEELSKPPTAAELARYAALRAHSHERPPTVIPGTVDEILDEVKARRDVLAELIDLQEWLALHIPALEARDLAEALIELPGRLSARDAGAMRQEVGRVMQTAYDLDRAGDLADAGRATQVFDRFHRSVEAIVQLYDRQ